MKKVRLSEEAARYLRHEKEYLSIYNPRASAAFVAQVKRAVRLLADYPFAGAEVAPVEGIRRFVSAPYHFDYLIRGDRITVISILHARQGAAALEKGADETFD